MKMSYSRFITKGKDLVGVNTTILMNIRIYTIKMIILHTMRMNMGIYTHGILNGIDIAYI